MNADQKTLVLSAAAIVILGFAAYANSLTGEFLLDDHVLVEDNVRIKSWSNLPRLFTEQIAAGGGRKWNAYRPLQMLTYMADYSLWRLNPWGYHFTNILLHLAAGLSIFWLLNLLFGDRLTSLFTALLFVAHPVHTEAVSYISGRADSLAAAAVVLCLVFYLKNLSSPAPRWHVLTLVCCLAALLSRENSLILPVLLPLCHFTHAPAPTLASADDRTVRSSAFEKKIRASLFLPVTGIVLGYLLLRLTVFKSFLALKTPSSTLLQRIPGFFVAVTGYLRLLLIPFPLHIEYGDKLFRFSDPRAVAGILLAAALIISAVLVRNRNRLFFFSLSWFLITLLPYSNLYPVHAYMAEHWLYLPSLGLFLLIGRGLRCLYTRKNLKIAALVLLISLLAFSAYLTVRQDRFWREPAVFYERNLKYSPESPRLLNSLGIAYNNAGRKEEALNLFKKAAEINPDYVDVYNNQALIYASLGKNEEAARLYREAIARRPDYAVAYNNLGLLHASMGNNEEAIKSYQRALEINPGYADVYNNLGSLFGAAGRTEEAVKLFRKAIRLNPDYAAAYNNLGIAVGARGQGKEAVALFKKALKIDPRSAQACNNLAVAYFSGGRYDLAVEYCDRAVERGYQVHPEFLKLLEPYR